MFGHVNLIAWPVKMKCSDFDDKPCLKIPKGQPVDGFYTKYVHPLAYIHFKRNAAITLADANDSKTNYGPFEDAGGGLLSFLNTDDYKAKIKNLVKPVNIESTDHYLTEKFTNNLGNTAFKRVSNLKTYFEGREYWRAFNESAAQFREAKFKPEKESDPMIYSTEYHVVEIQTVYCCQSRQTYSPADDNNLENISEMSACSMKRSSRFIGVGTPPEDWKWKIKYLDINPFTPPDSGNTKSYIREMCRSVKENDVPKDDNLYEPVNF